MKRKKISCETARSLSVMKALEKLGHFPTRETNQEAWFLSPLRSETQASFKVSKKLNAWYDHGAGIGGNTLDLVCVLLNVSVSDALLILAELKTAHYDFNPQQPRQRKLESSLQISEVKPLQHAALISYLKQRGISIVLARRYCSEVHFSVNSKPYFSIGLENQSGGWELRNAFYKNCSSPKDITHIKNTSPNLVLVEGMFDFLSILTAFPKIERSKDFLVLNSLSLVNRTWPILEKYDTIELYLDRDQAGRKTAALYLEQHSNMNCVDKSIIYSSYTDVNDWLIKRKL